MNQTNSEANIITQFLSISDWRETWDAYVKRAEENVAKQADAPPSWVRFIAGALGFFSSILALGIPAIALLIFDRVLTSGDANALWPLTALGAGTVLSVCLIDLMRMRALETYFTNVRGLVLYQDSCFAMFWAILLAFLHPALLAISAIVAITLFVLWRFRKPNLETRMGIGSGKPVDPVLADSVGLGAAYLQQVSDGRIQSREQPDFQTIGQASWLNLISLLALISTLTLCAWLVVQGSITPGIMVAAIFLNQQVISVFVRFFQVQTLKEPKQDFSFLQLVESGEARKKVPPASDAEVDFLSIQELEDFGFAAFSADLFQGLCLSLIGPSGSGKSEILRAIATGQFVEGKISFRGRNWGRNHGRYPALSYASPEPILLTGTLVENVTCFDPRASALDAIDLIRKLDPFEDVFRDKDFMNEGVDASNNAQAQIISLARAFWLPNDIIVLDQPETFLDKASRSALMSLILQAKTEGKIVIMSTDDDYLMSVADELVKLERGVVTDRGPMDEVLSRHHQRWVRVSFKPTKREAFRLTLWLEAQFPIGMKSELKERVKQTAQDMLFFAPRDEEIGDEEILFDVRMTPRNVDITMHDRGDVAGLDKLTDEESQEYGRVIEQAEGFQQTLRQGYRQIAVHLNDERQSIDAEA